MIVGSHFTLRASDEWLLRPALGVYREFAVQERDQAAIAGLDGVVVAWQSAIDQTDEFIARLDEFDDAEPISSLDRPDLA